MSAQDLHEQLRWIVSKATAFDYMANWDFTVKERPPDELLAEKLASLRTNWQEVAGAGLGDRTAPLRFAGRKKRRLIVEANFSFQPGWGTYDSLDYDKTRRRLFTAFRKRVNAVLAPHAVDHIEFVERRSK